MDPFLSKYFVIIVGEKLFVLFVERRRDFCDMGVEHTTTSVQRPGMTAEVASISTRIFLNLLQFSNPTEEMVFFLAFSICKIRGICIATSISMNVT